MPPDQPPFGDEDSELDDEDDFDLRDVSSDVEMDPEDVIPSDDGDG
jgi:FK506-binding nuclear protein